MNELYFHHKRAEQLVRSVNKPVKNYISTDTAAADTDGGRVPASTEYRLIYLTPLTDADADRQERFCERR